MHYPNFSLAELSATLDRLRRSDNHFYAVRVDGSFKRVRTRSVARQREGVRLAEAAAAEHTFDLQDVEGTLIGFWSPAYTARLTVPGYHLHFLSRDRTAGGHLLDCRGRDLEVQMQHEADLRLALPESPAFLRADLTQDSGRRTDPGGEGRRLSGSCVPAGRLPGRGPRRSSATRRVAP